MSILLALSLLAILSHLQSVSSQYQSQQPCYQQGGSCQGYCYVNCLSSAQQLSSEIYGCMYNSSSLQISMLQNQQISLNFLLDDSQSSSCMLNSITINGNVSTQVSVQQLLVLGGKLQQYTSNIPYYQFQTGSLKINVANLTNFTLTGLYFQARSNIQNDIVNILNCRNITIQNCNFDKLLFLNAGNTLGYQIINITQIDGQPQIHDSVVIQENQFSMNTFQNIGSVLFINNVYQNIVQIQKNQFYSNQQTYTSVIYILNIQSAMLLIQNNNFTSNTLYQNNGTVLTLYAPNSQIILSNNTYSFNQVFQGMGGCLYIYQSKSQISIQNEVHSSNQASVPQNYNPNLQGNGGSTYICQSQGQIVFQNCSYLNNAAVFYGGTIFLDTTSSVFLFIQANFLSNQAMYAGGLYLSLTKGSIEVENSYFFNNQATYAGGAIYFYEPSSTFFFVQTNFSSNTAMSYGGACYIAVQLSAIYFQSCKFFNNSVIQQGGAIYTYNNIEIIEFYQTNFSSNIAQNGGSIYIFESYGPIDFYFCTYFNNSAQQFGGALFIDSTLSDFLFQQTNFSSNTAQNGGSIFAQYSQSFIDSQSCYYQNNIASLYGGAVQLSNQYINVNFVQNYFQNNTAAYGGAITIQEMSDIAYFGQNIYLSNNVTIGGGAIFVQQSSGSITFFQEYHQLNQAGQVGGSIYISDFFENLYFINSSFILNQATNGGCIFLEYIDQNIYVSNNTFVNNQANTNGGGIYLQNCNNQPDIYNNSFKNNSAQGQGGGIFMLQIQQTIVINQCVFINNQAIQSGGAVTILQGLTIQIKQNTFFQNSALVGGAINIQQTQQSINITNCLFQKNIANQYGGAVILSAQSNSQASLYILMSQFQENSAINQGGADIYILLLGDVFFLSNQFQDSQSQQGGSIYVDDAISLTQKNCTFNNCVSQTQGSAIYVSNLTIVNMSEVSFVNCSANQGTVYITQTQNISITSIVLSQNTALDFAAGLYINSASIVQLQNANANQNYAQVDAGGFMLQQIQNLTIDGLQCYQNQAYSGNGGGVYIATTQATNLMGLIVFDNNTAGLQGGGMYLNNLLKNVQVRTQITLKNNYAYQGGGIAITSLSNQMMMIIITLNYFIFQSNQASYQGGGLYMQAQIDNQNIIQYSSFQNINIQFNVLQQSNQSQIVLNNCYFNNNSASFGGAVSILQNQLAIIQNCQFENNQAYYQQSASSSQTSLTSVENYGGGAVYLLDVQYSWTSNSSFQQNIAQQGGAFYQTQTDINSQITQQIYIFNNTFVLNTAAQLGGAVNLEYSQQIIEINGCLFVQNTALIAGSIMLSIQNIQFLDNQLRVLQNNQVTTLVAIAQNNFSKNSATNQAQYAQDIRILPNMQITPDQLDNIQSQLLSSNYFLSQTANAISLSCQPGEEQDLATNQCSPCAVGQYSQGGYAAQCVACPSNSQCAGNYQLIQVDQGYWRANSSSLAIIQCIHTPTQCLGGHYCEAGYTGILCEECEYDQGYERGSSPFTCAKCDSLANIWIISFIAVIFTGSMILVIVKGNIDYRNEQLQNLVVHRFCKYLIRVKDNTPALTRILIGHAQVLTIIFSINIQFPKYLVSFFNVFGQYTQVTSRNLICVFGTINGIHPAYMKVIYDHLAAFVTFLFLILILGILHLRKVLVFREQVKSFTLNLLIFLLPGMINELIPLLSQRSVDQITTETFTVLELGIVWGSVQFQYSYKLVIPLLVFWLAVFSGVVYVIFSQGKNFFQKRQERFVNQSSSFSNFKIKDNYPLSQRTLLTYNYGNLFIGYTQECYYWEAVMMTVRLALIIIQYVFAQNQIVVSSFSLLVLVLVMTQQFQNSPYQNALVKNLSNWCLIVQTVSIIFLQIIYIDQNNTWLYYFSLVIMIIINYSMMLILIQNFLKASYYYYLPFFQDILQNHRMINKQIQSKTCLQNNSFYKKLLKISHRDRIVNYGWNVVLNAIKNMIRFTRQSEEQQSSLILKHLELQIVINKKNKAFIDTNKANNLLVIKNLKKEVLFKTLFDDWKKNQQHSYYYKVYERWKDAMGQKIIDQMIDQQLEMKNLNANLPQLIDDLKNIKIKSVNQEEDKLNSKQKELKIQQQKEKFEINLVNSIQGESQLQSQIYDQYENLHNQSRQIDQDQSVQIQLIDQMQSIRSHEIVDDQGLHHSVQKSLSHSIEMKSPFQKYIEKK